VNAIYEDVARAARMDLETVKRDYADNYLVLQARERRMQEKVLKLLEDSAIFAEPALDEKTPDQE